MLFLGHGRGFQGDGAEFAAAVFVDEQGGGAVEVHVAALADTAALLADGFHKWHAFIREGAEFEEVEIME
jgi:hypothetical protein